MIAASQRPADARLLVVDRAGNLDDSPRARLVEFLRPGDLVVANDAATIPASLAGTHLPTGEKIEVRLAGRQSLHRDDVHDFSAIVFGAGDFHTRTEDRAAPPVLRPGDRLVLGPLTATVQRVDTSVDAARKSACATFHPLIWIRFEGSADSIWAGLARHGHPIQYSHVPAPLALWDVWTPIAGPPVAFEPPSAGFAIDWRMLAEMRSRGIGFATITHAAGISSTGDAELDARLPFDEPYRIPRTTARWIQNTREAGGRVIAVGTTVVRALEDAGSSGRVRSGDGLATGRIGPATPLRIVDAIISGTHEPGSSHYELLRAFVDDATLRRVTAELDARGYRTHEFGDSVLIEVSPNVKNSSIRNVLVAQC